MGKIYSHKQLRGRLKVGDKVRAVPGKPKACDQLQHDGSNTGTITNVDDGTFSINGCWHRYRDGDFLELVNAPKSLHDIETLEVGDELVHGDASRFTVILAISGRLVATSYLDNHDSLSTWNTISDLIAAGWQLKDGGDATKMTVAEVEAKLGHKVEIVADE